MYFTAIFIVSLHVLCVFGHRGTALLETCNWVKDGNAFYAINNAAPYCNVLNYYDDTDTIVWALNVSYSCDNGTVSKTMYDDDDCSTVSVNYPQKMDTLPDTDYNCDDTLTASCLLHRKSFIDANKNVDGASCAPLLDKLQQDVYQVNGACYLLYTDTEACTVDCSTEDCSACSISYYRLDDCSDCLVANEGSTDPNGFYIELYSDELCTTPAGLSQWGGLSALTIGDTECDYILECQGALDPVVRSLDPYAAIKDTCITAGTCSTEIENCLCDADCKGKLDWAFTSVCPNTAQDMAFGMNTDMSKAMFTCLYNADCLNVYEPECSAVEKCDMTLCVLDAECLEGIMSIFVTAEESGNDNPFVPLHDYCAGDGVDCTLLKATFECMLTCDSDDGGEEDECFTADLQSKLFTCIFDDVCYAALEAVFGDLFSGNSRCDTEFCSPTSLGTDKDTYCTDTTVCPTIFEDVFTAWTGCFQTECHFANCGTEITACEADAVCLLELGEIAHIEDNYHAAKDNDLVRIIKEDYCSKQTGGSCTSLLDAAWTCVADTNQCLTLTTDSCWETACAAQVDACEANGDCITTLLKAIKDETTCRDSIEDADDPLDDCPSCDELSTIKPADGYVFDPPPGALGADGLCGPKPQPLYPMYYEDGSNEELWLYEACQEACDKCGDVFLDAATLGCNSNGCDGTFTNLLKCVLPSCETGECHAECWEKTVDCLFTVGCWDDWKWVEVEFNTDYTFSETDGDPCSHAVVMTGTDEEIQAKFVTCRYSDIEAYCEAKDGCSNAFWYNLNCLLESCFGVTEFYIPPTLPPDATTPEPETFVTDGCDGKDVTYTEYCCTADGVETDISGPETYVCDECAGEYAIGTCCDNDDSPTSVLSCAEVECAAEPYISMVLEIATCSDGGATSRLALWNTVKECVNAQVNQDENLVEILQIGITDYLFKDSEAEGDAIDACLQENGSRGYIYRFGVTICGLDCEVLEKILKLVTKVTTAVFEADIDDCVAKGSGLEPVSGGKFTAAITGGECSGDVIFSSGSGAERMYYSFIMSMFGCIAILFM